MPTLTLFLTQTRYGNADAILSLTVAGVARPDVTVKSTDKRTPEVVNVPGTWLPGSTVAVALALKNDLWEQGKGDRNARVERVEMDGADLGIVRDVFGAAVVRFDVRVPAAKPTPAPAPAPTPAQAASLADKLDALAVEVKAIRAAVEANGVQLKAVGALAAETSAALKGFLAEIEIVAEGVAPAAE